jgi:hypothetical protein
MIAGSAGRFDKEGRMAKKKAVPATDTPNNRRRRRRVIPNISLQIIHIEDLARLLHVERRWINEHWFDRDDPAPALCEGRNVFFHVGELEAWFLRRRRQLQPLRREVYNDTEAK